ncbi:MAG: S9 family peptidase [Candidatus Krumholzibacteriota bacterium]|nr:S9 family peptidase [Candidatus Krumholzibacteriota bacterium]
MRTAPGTTRLLLLALCGTALLAASAAGGVFTAGDALSVRRAGAAAIAPDGRRIAFTVSVPREAGEEPGGAWSELWLASTADGELRPFVTGKVNARSPRFSPDGTRIAFLLARGKEAKTQVWTIPVDGGEAKQATDSPTGVIDFRWHPGGDLIAWIATEPKPAREKTLEEKGYGFIFFEENLQHRNLYIGAAGGGGEARRLTDGATVWSFEFAPSGETIAAAISPKNLVDHSYMFRTIHVVDVETGAMRRLTDNPGKLGNFAFSPDGRMLAYAAAIERKDHAVSQAFVIDVAGGEARNLTEPGFRGHVTRVGWRDRSTVCFLAAEGAWNTLNTVPAAGGRRSTILDGKEIGLVFAAPDVTADFRHFAFTASSPGIPGDLWHWKRGARKPTRLTTLNPWIDERDLGRQEVVRYAARDGLEIEGILVYPVGYEEGRRYPLVVSVHGGPESHYTNGWLTGYFNPAQVLAGRGYVVFYPNYRASTGYGLEFALAGYMDAAGREFDDIADGIDWLVGEGIADRDRVGLGGGSYGGYAAAWFATYYTDRVRAVCMFVGISDLVSKRSTTDIPWEELYVHSGKKLEEMWTFSLERSPVFHAHKSRSAVLILGGAADPRVHPSQSLEFYRRLKMNDHPAVRLVQYPGEGHGNRKQPGRIDVLYRHLDWYDWYVKNLQPLDGPLPPLDISERYGLDLEEAE